MAGGPAVTALIEVERRERTGVIWLNRPEKRNALSAEMWAALPTAADSLSADPEIRVIVVAARGPAFSVGIDLEMLRALAPEGESEASRRMTLYRRIIELQTTFNSLADSPKPIIAAIQGFCLGAGMDLVTACDIRLASADATFGVRETAMGLVADVGTLQRLPAIVGPGHVADLVYSGRDIDAARAARIGLVNDVYPDSESTLDAALELGSAIAANSPLVVQGAKKILNRRAARVAAEGLDYVAVWNAAFLLSDDLNEALTAFDEKRKPDFKGQ
jgi:Delta3,5-Delta2,4-dienoyl-CoA isomerase